MTTQKTGMPAPHHLLSAANRISMNVEALTRLYEQFLKQVGLAAENPKSVLQQAEVQVKVKDDQLCSVTWAGLRLRMRFCAMPEAETAKILLEQQRDDQDGCWKEVGALTFDTTGKLTDYEKTGFEYNLVKDGHGLSAFLHALVKVHKPQLVLADL